MSEEAIIDPNSINPDDYPRSYKAPILLYFFFSQYDPGDPQEIITASIYDVRNVAETLNMVDRLPPLNLANVFKDLVRNGKMPRYLSAIQDLGYEIRQVEGGAEFINVVMSPELRDAMDVDTSLSAQVWPSERIPQIPFHLIRTDEGGVLSALEYSGLLSHVFGSEVQRIQSPLKLQPNEVDGCYVHRNDEGELVFLSIEVKSKGGDVLLKHQIVGAARGALSKYRDVINVVVPVGVKLANDNSLYIALFEPIRDEADPLGHKRWLRFMLEPVPTQWLNPQDSSGQQLLL